jgi:hypothetical protein
MNPLTGKTGAVAVCKGRSGILPLIDRVKRGGRRFYFSFQRRCSGCDQARKGFRNRWIAPSRRDSLFEEIAMGYRDPPFAAFIAGAGITASR